MYEAVSIAGLCLLALGLADTRARPMALLLVIVWLETALIDASVSVDMSVVMRPVVDLVAGFMALKVIGRNRWSCAVPALFAVMLMCHAAYWTAWHNGIDLWYAYAHALNALWLCQLACVAWPFAGDRIARASSYLGSWLSSWRALALGRYWPGGDRSSSERASR